MPISAPTRRLLHDGPGLAMAQPRAHYLGDGGPSADYLQRSRIRGSGRRDVLWAKRFRFCSGAPPRSRRRRTASREFAQRVDSRSVREMRTAKLRSFPRKRESRPRTWVPATGSPRRERRGVPLAGDEERGVVFAATREPKYPFIRCSLFGRSNPREQALWTPSIATS